ncbi:peptide ABC transporter substrate-binding protein [Shigella sonnei]
MTNITKRSLVAAGVLAALMAGNVALAADVPAGVTLAEKQTNSWIRIRPLFLFITT